eukprot:scaffold322_cov363-Pavlova_lutheri.AAC.8
MLSHSAQDKLRRLLFKLNSSSSSSITNAKAHALYSALHTVGEWDTSPIKSMRHLPRDVHMGCTPRQDSIT